MKTLKNRSDKYPYGIVNLADIDLFDEPEMPEQMKHPKDPAKEGATHEDSEKC